MDVENKTNKENITSDICEASVSELILYRKDENIYTKIGDLYIKTDLDTENEGLYTKTADIRNDGIYMKKYQHTKTNMYTKTNQGNSSFMDTSPSTGSEGHSTHNLHKPKKWELAAVWKYIGLLLSFIMFVSAWGCVDVAVTAVSDGHRGYMGLYYGILTIISCICYVVLPLDDPEDKFTRMFNDIV